MSGLQLAPEPGTSTHFSRLRGLADDHGIISADTLCSATDVNEGFLSGLERQRLEQQLGAGPWPLVQLESFLVEAQVLTPTQSAQFAAPPAPPGPPSPPGPPDLMGLDADKISMPKDKLDDPIPLPKRQSFFKCLPELVLLERLVEDALANEDTRGIDEMEEPESEHPTMECSLSRLEQAISACANSPGLIRGEQEEFAACRMLPVLLQDAIGMLKKTWRLANVRGQHIKQLMEAARLTSGQEAHASEREHGTVEVQATGRLGKNTVSRLGPPADMASMKKALKEKDWELAHARQRSEHLDEERARLETRLLHMERSKQREAWSRGESERRLAELQSECSRSAEQRNDLQRRLAAARIALGRAHEASNEARRELGCAERRREEARLNGDWRAAELESELLATKQAVRELRLQLRQLNPSVADAAGEPLEQQQQEQWPQQQQLTQISSPSNGGSASAWPSRPRASTLEVVKEEDDTHGEESDHDGSCSSEARVGNSKDALQVQSWVPTVRPSLFTPPSGVRGELRVEPQQAAATATPKRQAVVAQSVPVPLPAAPVPGRLSIGSSSHNSSRAGSPTPGSSTASSGVARPTYAGQQRMSQNRAGGSWSWSPPRPRRDSITVVVEK